MLQKLKGGFNVKHNFSPFYQIRLFDFYFEVNAK